MKSFREYLYFQTKTRRAYINITPQVEDLIAKSRIKEGLCLVNAMHITASVFINDDENGLHNDFDKWLERLAPHKPEGGGLASDSQSHKPEGGGLASDSQSHKPVSNYEHNLTGEDNADAHLKRQIMGREAVVAITDGKLDFGPWEQIFYGEFDGMRKKRVLVKIIGE